MCKWLGLLGSSDKSIWSFKIPGNTIALKSTLYDIIVAPPAFFWVLLASYIFFHTFTFNLFVLYLNYICR